MRRWLWTLTVAPLLALALAGCHIVAVSSPGHRVVIAPAPPPVVVTARPRLVFVNEYAVYYAPDVEVDLYFADGFWFSFHQGTWFRSASYRGPWIVVESDPLPPGLARIPPGHLKKIYHDFDQDEHPKKGKGRRKHRD